MSVNTSHYKAQAWRSIFSFATNSALEDYISLSVMLNTTTNKLSLIDNEYTIIGWVHHNRLAF